MQRTSNAFARLMSPGWVLGWTIAALLVVSAEPALAGNVTVGSKHSRRALKEGAAKREFYVVDKGGKLSLQLQGPLNFVLLLRSERQATVDVSFVLDGQRQATKSIKAKPTISKGVFFQIDKGKHEMEMTPGDKAMVFPVVVKRKKAVGGEETVAWKPVEKPTAVAEAPAKPEEPDVEIPPLLPPVPEPLLEAPVPVGTAAEPSPPAHPPEPTPVAAAEQPPSPPAPAPEEPAATPAPEPPSAILPEIKPPSAAAAVEERVVSEERKEPEPPLDPSGIGLFGQRGVFRSWSAMPYPKYSIAVGSTVEYFKSSGFLADGDENQRLAGRLVASGVPLPGLEIAAGFSIVANNNTAFDPTENQSIGDPFLSVRYGYQILDWFAAGIGVQTLVPTGQRFSQLSTDGMSTRILFAFDFIPLPEALVSLNVGYHFDNSSRIFEYPLTEAQAFSAGVNPHDQVLVSLGFAWQFGPVAPFLEYGMAPAVGSDVGLGFADNPGWLTLGVRVWPLRFHTFHLMAAADIGLTGVSSPAGAARQPPYNVILSLGYDFGAAPPPAEVEKVVVKTERIEVPAPAGPKVVLGGGGSRVVGKVLDAGTGKPVGGARVVMGGDEPAIFLSDPEEGRFYTCPMVPGPVKLSVFREGYREESQVVLVTEKPETPVTIKLQTTAASAFGTIKGTVRAVTGLPLPALVAIPARNINIRAQRFDGSFERKLETGSFDVLFSMPGYVTQRRKVKLEAGDVVIINVELYPKK